MKLLFLDFDGVLNSAQFARLQHRNWVKDKLNPRPYRDEFCPICCSNLLWVIEKNPDLKIVISSSWRLGTPLEELQALLERHGIPGILIIGKTPHLVNPGEPTVPRGLEIQKWLDDHKELDVERFCIVDDDSDMEHLSPLHVKTDFQVGLDWIAATKLINLLAGKTVEPDLVDAI
jgi:HAD domain in Swiss Army Knife RNA repair proteins